MPDFEERIYELGTEALAEQERQVAEVRSRGATLLAAGAVIGSLLAKPVFGDDHPDGTAETIAAVLGVFGAGALLIFVVLLLIPREMGFQRQRPRDLSGALGSADPAAADGRPCACRRV